MKNICFFNLVLVLFVSCQQKQEKVFVSSTIPTQLQALDVVIVDTTLSNNFDDIDFDKLPRMTMALYDSLQLYRVEALLGYDTTFMSMGRILLANENGKIITVKIITDGEIMEYLLSYDKKGSLVDNLLVSYEDMVEYYSQISSKIDSNKITIQTVNFSYSDDLGNPVELSDTIIAKYEISPEFKFTTM